VWSDINKVATGQVRSHFFSPGMVIAVNRQRMADVFPVKASRSEFRAQNVFVLVHFDQAKPDQGRKTLQPQLMEFAQHAADAAIQYLLKQNSMLKEAGEKTTAAQREVERNHEDWKDNVKAHQKSNPLAIPPVSYISTPLTEQDVIGLFHQLSALGLFPGLEVFATSAAHTYDCYVRFDCKSEIDLLRYGDITKNPLGLSSDVFAPEDTQFSTRGLTLEFKNNLDALIEDLDDEGERKTFNHIDICVCWGVLGEQHRSYSLAPIDESNLHERKYPGVTHLLRKDGEAHVMQVIMLEHIVQQIGAGHIVLPGRSKR
jgi:hypothetical protein